MNRDDYRWLRWLVEMAKMARKSGSRVIVEDRLRYFEGLVRELDHAIGVGLDSYPEADRNRLGIELLHRIGDAARHREAIRGILKRVDAERDARSTDPTWITRRR